MVGGGANVDDDLGPGIGLGSSWSRLVPDILAYSDADAHSSDAIDGATAASTEVAVFIEYPVVGQEYLMVEMWLMGSFFTIFDAH